MKSDTSAFPTREQIEQAVRQHLPSPVFDGAVRRITESVVALLEGSPETVDGTCDEYDQLQLAP